MGGEEGHFVPARVGVSDSHSSRTCATCHVLGPHLLFKEESKILPLLLALTERLRVFHLQTSSVTSYLRRTGELEGGAKSRELLGVGPEPA